MIMWGWDMVTISLDEYGEFEKNENKKNQSTGLISILRQ